MKEFHKIPVFFEGWLPLTGSANMAGFLELNWCQIRLFMVEICWQAIMLTDRNGYEVI